MKIAVISMLASLWVIGCFTVNPSGNDSPGNDPDTTDSVSSFTEIQKTVFTPYCVGCHSPNNASGGFDISGANSYHNIVNIPSTRDSAYVRVKPYDKEHSYLYMMLLDSNGIPTMPPEPLAPLARHQIELIGAWIDSGAMID